MTNFIVFASISIILIALILIITYIFNKPTQNYEKHSSYECGFEPFGDARNFFDIHLYIIGVLFIIFDLEIVFLIPFVIDIANTTFVEYFFMLFFMLIVLAGFYYEWTIGLLNWLPTKNLAKNESKNT